MVAIINNLNKETIVQDVNKTCKEIKAQKMEELS